MRVAQIKGLHAERPEPILMMENRFQRMALYG